MTNKHNDTILVSFMIMFFSTVTAGAFMPQYEVEAFITAGVIFVTMLGYAILFSGNRYTSQLDKAQEAIEAIEAIEADTTDKLEAIEAILDNLHASYEASDNKAKLYNYSLMRNGDYVAFSDSLDDIIDYLIDNHTLRYKLNSDSINNAIAQLLSDDSSVKLDNSNYYLSHSLPQYEVYNVFSDLLEYGFTNSQLVELYTTGSLYHATGFYKAIAVDVTENKYYDKPVECNHFYSEVIFKVYANQYNK